MRRVLDYAAQVVVFGYLGAAIIGLCAANHRGSLFTGLAVVPLYLAASRCMEVWTR